ncbi:Mobilization protein BmgA [Mucinivorans hirudinis]|uniref:Mobilization protein BmgA n=1 Tax=Mucinivorans hirudinis TaxID=1433126 RepID=A0A060RAS8_9BACT|nr:Mobilization protein BmgA [Mucinivorans hirudinis]
MAKIVQGTNFAAAITYLLNRKEASVIATEGIRDIDKEAMIRSFEMQAKLNPITKPVAHISLDFSAQDRDKMTDQKMIEIATEYINAMGYGNTQVLMVRHFDREHPHVHLILNRIDYDCKRISDQNERIRSTKVCRELTLKHDLYLSSGKENVKRHRLREPDATKYRIYDALCKHVPHSKSWDELQNRLRPEGIEIGFKTKGSTDIIEGVRFTMNNLTFNGSKVDRKFSYSKIDFALKVNQKSEQEIPQFSESSNDGYAPNDNSPLGGLFDLPENPAIDPEEERFRRRMQKKKRRKI